MGPDAMHLRELVDEVAKPLSYLRGRGGLGRSAVTGEGATSPPLLKRGKKEDSGNYRPVSLTSVPGKMME